MIYLDVDGVIADFEMGIRALGWTESLNLAKEDRTPGGLARFMSENYTQIFRTAPPTNHMQYFQHMYQEENYLESEKNMMLLTAMGAHYSEQQIEVIKENKLWWLEQFGFKREDTIIVPRAADKLKYCQPGDVLYDDKRWTIERWNQLGGHGFLVYYQPSWSSNED